MSGVAAEPNSGEPNLCALAVSHGERIVARSAVSLRAERAANVEHGEQGRVGTPRPPNEPE